MISILNRPHELRAHIRGALTNGVSRDEIREVFMQVAIYAGIPAGVDSFRIAREVFVRAGSGNARKVDRLPTMKRWAENLAALGRSIERLKR
jgi:hypothetical protein